MTMRLLLPIVTVTVSLVAQVFAIVIVLDQMHWWRLKPEYMFGWLVPFFVGFVVLDRWPRTKAALRATGGAVAK